jgi:two-component system response regulator RegA
MSMTMINANPPDNDRPSLLLVDDDELFSRVMSEALGKRGFNVNIAYDVDEAIAISESQPPEYATIDLSLPGRSGLELVKHLLELDGNTRIVVVTGYASIATAVEAVKLGAIHYLAKPVDADDVVAAFQRVEGDAGVAVVGQPLSVGRLEWEHIQKVLAEHDGNISATARALNMHRRTLQRKLQRRPVSR